MKALSSLGVKLPIVLRSSDFICNSTGDSSDEEEEEEIVEGSEEDEEDEESEEEGDDAPPPAKRPGLHVSFNTKEELCSCHICLPQYTSRRLTSCIDTQFSLIKNITSDELKDNKKGKGQE